MLIFRSESVSGFMVLRLKISRFIYLTRSKTTTKLLVVFMLNRISSLQELVVDSTSPLLFD